MIIVVLVNDIPTAIFTAVNAEIRAFECLNIRKDLGYSVTVDVQHVQEQLIENSVVEVLDITAHDLVLVRDPDVAEFYFVLRKPGSGVRRPPTAAERAAVEDLAREEFKFLKVDARLLKSHNLTALDIDGDSSPEFVGSFYEIGRAHV